MDNYKENVINPIEYFNTVGQEIEEILLSNDKDINKIIEDLDWKEKTLTEIIKVKKSEAIFIQKELGIQGIDDYIMNFQKKYKESKQEAERVYKLNNKIYKKVKHLEFYLRGEFNSGIDKLEDISDFLEIDDESEIFEKVNENIALYKISNFVPDNLNLYAWLKRGELDFYKKHLPSYNREAFLGWIKTKEYLNHIYDLDYIKKLPSVLEEYGVGLVYTEYLNKTVHGAVRWFDERPLVQVSDKNKCLGTFWYTLFHEFGHVIEHENDEVFEGNLDLPKSKINKKEKEANAFAYNYLFNGDYLRKFVFKSKYSFVDDDYINKVSARFNVHKIFTAYWMRKALIKSKTIKLNLDKFDLTEF
ncbi:ImmA/IrrE family metallo-endopeptidase [Tenacibaculum mesophilum]|uniref:ImmA/IrrE family metallo-endopeptidase n=1 Tax=Tenacibaculum mesophilum TaxID=104268 RepID=UPI00249120E2|nr:ImmA/IrrE family metallo-endopeptidase [Tenacibaculum mesophilum]